MLDPTLFVNDVMGDVSPNLEDENLTKRNMVTNRSNQEILQGFRHNALVVARGDSNKFPDIGLDFFSGLRSGLINLGCE